MRHVLASWLLEIVVHFGDYVGSTGARRASVAAHAMAICDRHLASQGAPEVVLGRLQALGVVCTLLAFKARDLGADMGLHAAETICDLTFTRECLLEHERLVLANADFTVYHVVPLDFFTLDAADRPRPGTVQLSTAQTQCVLVASAALLTAPEFTQFSVAVQGAAIAALSIAPSTGVAGVPLASHREAVQRCLTMLRACLAIHSTTPHGPGAPEARLFGAITKPGKRRKLSSDEWARACRGGDPAEKLAYPEAEAAVAGAEAAAVGAEAAAARAEAAVARAEAAAVGAEAAAVGAEAAVAVLKHVPS
jgi:hypothetical protein